MKTDALNRRSRFAKPQPMMGRIILSDRDDAIFEALDRHGQLSSNYIHAFTKDAFRAYDRLRLRLTSLYNGFCEHPEHKRAGFGPVKHECQVQSYLTRHPAQFNNIQARYQPAVYGITPLAKVRILEKGTGAKFSPERNDPFIHQFFGGCFSASFELLAKPHRFIGREEILQHERCPKATRMSPNPFALPVADQEIKHIVPDNLFGIEYQGGGFRFFAVEIDRNTESINPKKAVKNSIAKKVRGYTDILENRTYASHLGLPNLTVLIATSNAGHMQRMIQFVQEEVDPKYHGKFLFQAFPTFGDNWRVPRELLDVFEPWKSAAGEVDISTKA